ncbi:hypothetical protein RJ639_006849 [Escallonia herrerae]|uniref:Uncharacterized protein n=1 Tax=Escallonia herrerae TaxID=1293975 RepID=A0AA88VW02_9ASTE|nr:hypothetical protein RJ639_006849 [Escallonia herrerae]
MHKEKQQDMEGLDTSISLSSLLCQEDDSFLGQHQNPDEDLDSCSLSESEDEYVQTLLGKETSLESFPDSSEMSKRLPKHARLDAINWVLNTRAFFGFHSRTAYLSLIYFDRFLSRRSIDNGNAWAIQLLSVACFSLAAKMEECNAPALSQYHVNEYNFEGNVIQKMELLVLNTLDWKMGPVTPFAYLHYFIAKFCGDTSPKELVSRAYELILAITKEINLMDHSPSVIAAASVLAACHGQLTREAMESKTSVISSWGSLDKEHILYCYNLLQEIEMGRSKTPESLVSTDLSAHHSRSAFLEDSSNTSAVGAKRKLTFLDDDQHKISRT